MLCRINQQDGGTSEQNNDRKGRLNGFRALSIPQKRPLSQTCAAVAPTPDASHLACEFLVFEERDLLVLWRACHFGVTKKPHRPLHHVLPHSKREP